MSPKEKANELVNIYLRIEDDTSFYWEGYWDRKMDDEEVLSHAIKCALETAKQATHITGAKYWYNVKQEIEKL